MVGNDLKLDEGIGVCGKEGQSVPVGVGIPTDQDRQDDRGRHGLSQNHLLELAAETVKQALARGATDAECTISEGDEFSANVRMREVETLKEAGSRGAGLRILIGKRTGSAYTSDLSPEGIAPDGGVGHRAGRDHDAKIRIAGLPDAAELGSLAGDLQLYCADVERLETPFEDRAGARAPKPPRSTAIRASPTPKGASFDSRLGRRVFANSRGFAGEYRSSYCSLAAVPVAREGESMERDYWFSIARSFAGLETPEHVGRIAAERALRRLGARKVETQSVPVIFEPRTARSPAGQHLRSRAWRIDLPPGVVPRRQTGREDRRRKV